MAVDTPPGMIEGAQCFETEPRPRGGNDRPAILLHGIAEPASAEVPLAAGAVEDLIADLERAIAG